MENEMNYLAHGGARYPFGQVLSAAPSPTTGASGYSAAEIKEIVNRETRAWNTQDVDLFLSIFHEDMVWPWPTDNKDHDPINWELKLGKFDYRRWKSIYTKFFKEHKLIHNNRKIVKIKSDNYHTTRYVGF